MKILAAGVVLIWLMTDLPSDTRAVLSVLWVFFGGCLAVIVKLLRFED